MKKNILVIAPHADDEILGLGGTIAKNVKKKNNVTVAILCNANIGAPEIYSDKKIRKIRNEALKSHNYLGVKETIFADFPALTLNTYPLYKIAKYLNDLFIKIKPQYLYIPFPNDLHDDHQIIYKSCLVAARPSKKININNILIYEVLSETNYTPNTKKIFTPNYYEDITSTISIKLKAMSFYKSQIFKYPHSRSLKMIKYLANFRGAAVNKMFAEAFMVERIYKE